MATVRYALLAESDLDDIAEYTRRVWDEDQAVRYLDEIEMACLRLAESPRLGRLHRGPVPGLRRMEQGSHVIFYVADEDGIYVGRILHTSMLPSKQGL